MDGIASASIVKLMYPDAKCIPVNYGDNWNVNDVIDSYCIIVDFSFDNMQELKQYTDKLCWIDHHKTAIDKNDKNIYGIRDISKSGCELTWQHFFPEIKMPRAVELIGDRDMWIFKYGDDTRAYHEYVSMKFKKPNIELFNKYMVDEAIKNGMILLDKKKEHVRRSFEQGWDIVFQGHKTRVINSNLNVSDTGEYCYKDKGYAVAMIWSIRNDEVIFSLRSDTVDVCKLAEKYNGGGHKFSAGFKIKTVDKEFVNVIKGAGK